jgi:hypothetical protein
LELASRELGLDKPSRQSTGRQLAQPIAGSPGGTCHGLKLREYGLNVPKFDQTEGAA